jgi:hypothetical protein
MEMNSTALFFVSTILFGLSAIVIVAAALVVNNLLHKYWKPVKLFSYQYKEVLYSSHVDQNSKTEDNGSTNSNPFAGMINTLTGAHNGKDVQNGAGKIDRS